MKGECLGAGPQLPPPLLATGNSPLPTESRSNPTDARIGPRAPNDHDGHRVWLKVAEAAESLLRASDSVVGY
jgi:hypothetical protein